MVSLISMKLSIITLNFKKKELTVACVASLYKHYQKQFERNEFELIIVDNFSQDDSVPFIKKDIEKHKYKNVSLLQNEENSGFGGGCNLGAEKAKGEYVLFLNNDTQVLDAGFIGMTEFLDSRPHVGILGGRMENEDRSPQASAGKFYTFFNAVLMIFGLQRLGLIYSSPNIIQKSDWVSGGCMMVRKSMFDKIGEFDPEIFMYFEDVEICYRAKKAGFLTYYYPHVTTLHIGQGSSNRTFAIVNIYKGLIYFYKKHMPMWQTNMIELLLKLKAYTLIKIGKMLKNSYLVSTYEEALTVLR